MQEEKYITVNSKWKKVTLKVSTILYIHMRRKYADIYMTGERVCETRTNYKELKDQLGDGFIEVRRGTIVSVIAIHNVTQTINLNNGLSLKYTLRRKKEIEENLYRERKNLLSRFSKEGVPITKEEYFRYYSGFEHVPFAFADIEMIFDETWRAADWIFRYGNSALAELEKVPLDKLIGNTFGTIFHNMDSKWLQCYERASLFRETLELTDYSPEIDTYLKVICFPTFEGHCGCILFNIENIEFTRSSDHTEIALGTYFKQYLEKYAK
ncbi:MAG: LytTR family transcriptional regulator DNA-binding domain-containing protein [Lachnospiraceae bacterium]